MKYFLKYEKDGKTHSIQVEKNVKSIKEALKNIDSYKNIRLEDENGLRYTFLKKYIPEVLL